MATRPNAAATSQALTLLGQFTDSIDSLPHDLTKAFGDLRELDAVLRSSMQGITSKVYKLIDLMQDSSATPAARLCLLLEIAEDAQRLRMGSEDKIRVAGRTADDVAAHNQYNHQILSHLSELDPAFDEALYIRRTNFPHVAPANLAPPTGEYALGPNGRRRRVPTGGVAQSSVSIGARLSAPMAVSASAGGDKNKKRRLEEEEARRTPSKGKEKDQRMPVEKEREAAADSRRAKKARTQRSPSPDDSARPHGNRNFDQQYPSSAPAPNGYPHHQSQSHHHHHHHHHSHSHSHHKSSAHIPSPQNNHGYAQPQPSYAPPGPYPPHSMPPHDAKHTVKPARTSSLLDVVANRGTAPNDYAHPHNFGSSPTFEPDDYEHMDRHPRRSGGESMRTPAGGRSGGSYPNGNGYGAGQKESLSGRGAPNDSTSGVLTGNANANGNGEPGDGDDSRTYCYCDRVSYGEMIGCDDDQCRREWFHLGCLNMTAPPKGEWVCDECKARRDKERAGKKSARSRGGAASRPSASNTTPNGSAPPPNNGPHRSSVPPQQPLSRNAGGK